MLAEGWPVGSLRVRAARRRLHGRDAGAREAVRRPHHLHPPGEPGHQRRRLARGRPAARRRDRLLRRRRRLAAGASWSGPSSTSTSTPSIGLVYGDLRGHRRAQARHRAVARLRRHPTRRRARSPVRCSTATSSTAASMAFRGAFKDDLVPLPRDVAWEDWWFAWAADQPRPGRLSGRGHLPLPSARPQPDVRRGRRPERRLGPSHAGAPVPPLPAGQRAPGDVQPSRAAAARPTAFRVVLRSLEASGRDVDALLAVSDQQRAAAAQPDRPREGHRRLAPTLAAFSAARALAAEPMHDDAFQCCTPCRQAERPPAAPPDAATRDRVRRARGTGRRARACSRATSTRSPASTASRSSPWHGVGRRAARCGDRSARGAAVGRRMRPT